MPRYDQVRYLSSHNSYSGDIKGSRKSLKKQLDSGMRCIEFDFHDDGYANPDVGDYRVGHFGPGKEVDHKGGNPPESLLLTDWLEVLAAWSAHNPGHGAITIVLDAKDPLADNKAAGDLADFNSTLRDVFRTQLFTRDDYDVSGKWPDGDDLKNKFLCVLSGDMRNRNCYRWDFGKAPAIAVNAKGDAVMVFGDDSGDLLYWSGRADAAAEAIEWSRRNTYEHSNRALFEPAVAINDDRCVVVVHRFFHPQIPNGLWSRLGRLQDNGRIEWFKEKSYGLGNNPTLKIEGLEITEIHRQSDSKARTKVLGTIDASKKPSIKWQPPKTTTLDPFPIDTAKWGGFTIKCGIHKTQKWLGCRFDDKPLLPARFEQFAFVEMQGESQKLELIDPRFFAAPADSSAAIGKARKEGLVARGWGFSKANAQKPADPKENFAATDTPFADWYTDYMQQQPKVVIG